MEATEPVSLFYRPYDPETEAEALIDFLCSDAWPFHLDPRPTPERARERLPAYHSEADKSFWIEQDGAPIGLVAIHELDDPTPTFDLRIRASHRGRGLGRHILDFIALYVFTDGGKHRVEGHTRFDNTPMRRVFEKAGWLQEAHYREAWPDEEGRWHDAVACALLKREWDGDA